MLKTPPKTLTDAARAGLGGVDILVNNAGGSRASDRPLVIGEKIDPAQYAAQF